MAEVRYAYANLGGSCLHSGGSWRPRVPSLTIQQFATSVPRNKIAIYLHPLLPTLSFDAKPLDMHVACTTKPKPQKMQFRNHLNPRTRHARIG